MYINPVAFSVYGFDIYWYSFAYILGVLFGWYYACIIIKKFKLPFSITELDNFITWLICSIIVGGRMGYIIMYDLESHLMHPLKILNIRNGGMSFHGALIGVIIGTYRFSTKYKINFFTITDIVAVVCPIGLFFGRIANFINCELYGRVTNVAWGMVFYCVDSRLRHPSQLYEAFFEGFLLFIILMYSTFVMKNIINTGLTSGLFLLLYSSFRIFIECFREPDIQLGFIISNITLGQILSVPMLILGLVLIFTSFSKSTKLN